MRTMDEEVKILCVDDERSVLKALERLFLDTDYEIITAESGEEGIATLENEPMIQLVISDYRMPKMNGVDFLRDVYRLRPDTVRIVLSGYADTAAIVEAINEGQIYKFIPKPWNDDELKVTIAKALEHYFTSQKIIQLTKELESKNKELQEINNNLEKLVEGRTFELRVRNQVLTCSQNILDSLPVGVVGIDPDDLVVQCNRRGLEMLDIQEGNILGMDRKEAFPDQINAIIDVITEKGEQTGCISANGSQVQVRGVYMKYDTGQEGVILVLNEEKGNDGSS